MAEYILDVMSQTSKLDWAFPFQRTGAFPIDRSAVFSSLKDAQAYAIGDGSDERELGGTSYVGQIISVYETNEDGAASANAYIITPARGLMKLAATTASGDVVADIVELQGQVNSILSNIESLEGLIEEKADAAEVEAALASKTEKEYVDSELEKKADLNYVNEELAKKANASEVEEALAQKANVADVYNKTEVYTKTEVESYVSGQIGSAGHLKRVIVEVLPEVSDAEVDTIYMVKKTGEAEGQDKYEEFMVINNAWEVIGDTRVDLSDYATTKYVDDKADAITAALALKADQTALDATNENLAKKADIDSVNAALAQKADKDQVATDIANAIAPLALKAEVEAALAEKADVSTVNELAQLVANNNSSMEEALANKADKATTLSGYGITDAYTKEEVDAALLLKASQQDHNALVDIVNTKANAADVYTKTEADNKFAEKATTLAGYGITDAYTIAEANKAIEDALKLATGGESASDVLVALNNYKTENDLRVSNAENRIKALEEAESDNIIEAIKLQGAENTLEVVDKTVTLPAATTTSYGLTKLSEEIGTNDSGNLEIKAVKTSKLVQDNDEWLILNGGTAAV